MIGSDWKACREMLLDKNGWIIMLVYSLSQVNLIQL